MDPQCLLSLIPSFLVCAHLSIVTTVVIHSVPVLCVQSGLKLGAAGEGGGHLSIFPRMQVDTLLSSSSNLMGSHCLLTLEAGVSIGDRACRLFHSDIQAAQYLNCEIGL